MVNFNGLDSRINFLLCLEQISQNTENIISIYEKYLPKNGTSFYPKGKPYTIVKLLLRMALFNFRIRKKMEI